MRCEIAKVVEKNILLIENNMNSITPLWIIDMLSSFKDDRVKTTLLLANKEQ